MDAKSIALVGFAFGLAWLGCSSGDAGEQPGPAEVPSVALEEARTEEPGAPSADDDDVAESEPLGDAERGRRLVEERQCHRCHDGLSEMPAIAHERHCTACHADVMEGRFKNKPGYKGWRQNVAHLTAVPSLEAVERLRYGWLVDFLMEPHDLRPNLTYDMPRLGLRRDEARDIATYLKNGESDEETRDALAGADPRAGAQLFEAKGCPTCHAAPAVERESRVAVALAPDLRNARERLEPSEVIAWLRDPAAVKPGTPMPKVPMTEAEARDIAAHLLEAELAEAAVPSMPELPPPLERAVTFDEVDERIFHKTCRHCHGDPDQGLGDGGPGNTGGFGFKPRSLELTSYERVMAGYNDEAGVRHSVFEKTEQGVPRIVAALMARHAEKAGHPDPEVRGMPLALPPLPLEDIQLLVTWIAQGRRR